MLGQRLKMARKKSGYSLSGLSEALDVPLSAYAISEFEKGKRFPNSKELVNLANTLEVSLDFLLSGQLVELESIEFRKKFDTSSKERARVEVTVLDWLQRYLVIEKILELSGDEWSPPKLKNRYLGEESDSEILAAELRKEWRLGLDPIQDMTALLEFQGIKVLVDDLPDNVSGLTCIARTTDKHNAISVIVANRKKSLERRRLTLAHELAHCLIDESSSVDQERAATMFAGAFLMPRGHLVVEIGKIRTSLAYAELMRLKRMYGVSAAALLVRLKQIGVIDQETLAHAFKTFARSWKTTEPEPIESHNNSGCKELPRRFEQLCYRALAEEYISPRKAGELLKVPVNQIISGIRGPVDADSNNRM